MIHVRLLKTILIACLAAVPSLVRADDPPPQRPAAGHGAASFLQSAREKVDSLNPTPEQKEKIAEIFNNAEGDLKRTFADAQNMSPEERRQKFTEFMSGLKEKIAAVLTDEQKAKFESMPLTGPAAGGAAGGRAGQVGERLKAALEKLDLSAEQKEKVKKLMEEEKAKMEELRKEAQSGDRQKVRDKSMAAMKEIRDKLTEILTPEQQEKLKEAIGNGIGRGGQRPAAGGGENPDSKPSN